MFNSQKPFKSFILTFIYFSIMMSLIFWYINDLQWTAAIKKGLTYGFGISAFGLVADLVAKPFGKWFKKRSSSDK